MLNLKRAGLAILLAAAVLAPWSAAATPSPRASRALMFLPDCMGTPQSHPPSITITCADGNMVVTNLRWIGWGESVTAALGVFKENTCSPDCASSRTWISSNMVLIASGIQRCPNGALAYRKITYAFIGTSPFPRDAPGTLNPFVIYPCVPQP